MLIGLTLGTTSLATASAISSLFDAGPEPIPEPFELLPDERSQLRAAKVGERVLVQSLVSELAPLSAKHAQPLAVERIEIHAPGRFAYEVRGEQMIRLSRDPIRQFYYGSDGFLTVGFALDKDGTVTGVFARNGRRYRLSGHLEGTLSADTIKQTGHANVEASCKLDDINDSLRDNLPVVAPEFPSLRAAQFLGTMNSAVIAIDTDNEFMTDKFTNNATSAQTWVENLFVNMNVFYERDLGLRLLIGDELYRTTADPYASTGIGSGYLDEFGNVWRTTPALSSINRVFVALLSGKVPELSFSGIAWVAFNASTYCSAGGINGSGGFNLNGIGSHPIIDEAFTAELVGHEIGHNLGSVHTHCYSPPIDMCFNREDGCYSDPEICPVGNRGTVMSYCHLSNVPCSNDNLDEFHPTVISELSSQISTDLTNNGGTCIMPLNSNNSPVANSNNYAMDEDTTLYIAPPGVLGNDTDAEMEMLTAVEDGSLANLTLNSDGSFSYEPPADFSGVMTFNYHANDGTSDSNTTTVNIVVQDVVEPPDYLFRTSHEGDTPPP